MGRAMKEKNTKTHNHNEFSEIRKRENKYSFSWERLKILRNVCNWFFKYVCVYDCDTDLVVEARFFFAWAALLKTI